MKQIPFQHKHKYLRIFLWARRTNALSKHLSGGSINLQKPLTLSQTSMSVSNHLLNTKGVYDISFLFFTQSSLMEAIYTFLRFKLHAYNQIINIFK